MTENLMSSLNMNRKKKEETVESIIEDTEEMVVSPAEETEDETIGITKKNEENHVKEALEVNEDRELAKNDPTMELLDLENADKNENKSQEQEREHALEGTSEHEERKTQEVENIEEKNHKAEEKEDEIYYNKDGSYDYDKIVSKSKLMSLNAIYSSKNFPENLDHSVFIIESYANTLPENLPRDVKRQSVLNILKVSSLNVDELLQDGFNRIDILNEILEDVALKTEDMDKENMEDIAELSGMIEELRETMAKRAEYQEKQNRTLSEEIERIVGIVEFLTPS